MTCEFRNGVFPSSLPPHREIEELRRHSGKPHKLFCAVPHARLRISFVHIPACALRILWDTATSVDHAHLSVDDQEEGAWHYFFDLDKVRALRANSVLRLSSFATDGVSVCLLFERPSPLLGERPPARELPDGSVLLAPGLYDLRNPDELARTQALLANRPPSNLVACDPGVKRVLAMASLDAASTSTLSISQGFYREASGLRWRMHKAGTAKLVGSSQKRAKRRVRNRKKKKSGKGKKRKQQQRPRHKHKERRSADPERVRVREEFLNSRTKRSSLNHIESRDLARRLSALPTLQTALASNVIQYVQDLGPMYAELWARRSRLFTRKAGLHVYRKRRQFMDGIVQAIKDTFGPNVTIAFGAAGPFSRLRGCGVKGPIQEIKYVLAKHFPVLLVSEHRTSKLCRQCGLVDTKYRHGVAFCKNTDSHPMRAFNRDIEAARKIAARTFAELHGLDLGPWAKGSVLNGNTSTALVDAQDIYSALLLRGQRRVQPVPFHAAGLPVGNSASDSANSL